MFKNTASQKIELLVIDTVNNVPKTGDAANITAYVSKDYGAVTVLGDTTATEADATNAPGIYLFDVTQTETNADNLLFSGKSSTANIRVVARIIRTSPPNSSTLSIDSLGRVTLNPTQPAVTFTSLTSTGAFTISDGIIVTASTTNRAAFALTGNGTGSGIDARGGGDGVIFQSTSSGHGFRCIGLGTSKAGFRVDGGGATSAGLQIIGGTTSGDGIAITTTSGHGINTAGSGSAKHGIQTAGSGTGTSHGLYCLGGSSAGDGIRSIANASGGTGLTLTGSGTGQGALISAGTGVAAGLTINGGGTTGVGVSIITTSGDGLSITPTAGHAIVATGNGTTKHGLNITGGATSSHGISVTGGGTGDGISVLGGSSSGVGIRSIGGGTGGVGLGVYGGSSSGEGLYVYSNSGNALSCQGGAAGAGFYARGGATGPGMSLVGGATSGNSVDQSVTSGNPWIEAGPIARRGTAQAGAGTTITLDASASSVTDYYKNDLVYIVSGLGAAQARFITAYNGTTKVATVQSAWGTNPDNTSVFYIIPNDSVVGATAPTAAQVATAVWQDLLASGDFATASSIGKLLNDNINATISSRMATFTLPTNFSALNINASGHVTIQTGTGAGQLDFTSGVVKANVTQLLGTAWLTPGTAGTPDVNVKLWNALTTVSLPLVPTVAGRTLDVSTTGEAGIDWSNVGGATATLNLSNTTISTLTTYTGNTPQTGDSFARIGANGASLTAIPTLTTAMTESYAADGVAPTAAQALYAIQQRLFDFAISGSLLTIYKLDGVTQAAQITMNSSTAPTTSSRTS